MLADGRDRAYTQELHVGGAGIGAGNGTSNKQVTGGELSISGTADVTAIGGAYSAGIGGGKCGNGANVTIEGNPTVKATGGQGGAGIGGGWRDSGNYGAEGGVVDVKGGTVTAQAGASQSNSQPEAIGHGSGYTESGTISLYNTAKVLHGSQAEGAGAETSLAARRVSDCRDFWTQISPCDHKDADGNATDTYTPTSDKLHHTYKCAQCLIEKDASGTTIEYDHDFGTTGECVCGTRAYKVQFNKNASDATGSMAASDYVIEGKSYTLPKCDFTRAGYEFSSWNTKANGSGTSYVADTSSIVVDADTTVYAQWGAIPATPPTISSATGAELTYGYAEGSVSVSASAATDTTYNDLAYQWYSCKRDGSDAEPISAEEEPTAATAIYTIPTGKAAGTTEYYRCVVTATRADNGQKETATSDVVTVTVSKIDSSVTMAPEITNPTYSGEAQELVTAGTAEGGTMQYSLDGESYSRAIPTGTDATEYVVWYKVVGDENHSDTEPAYITVTISPKGLTVRAMDKNIEVGEEVPDLSKPTLGEDYTVDGLVGSDTLTTAPKLVYSSKPDNTKVGTYAITASGADAGENYTIEYAPGTLTISKKQPDPDPTPTKKGTLTFNLNGGTLDGKTGKLTIKAKVGDTITIPDAPTRKGYTFQYWKGSRYNPGDKYEVVGDHTFTAMWTKNSGSGTNGSRSTRSTSGATRRRVTPNTGDVSVGTASLAALTAAGLCLVARGLRLKTQ